MAVQFENRKSPAIVPAHRPKLSPFFKPMVQAKYFINPSTDFYEQQANSIAEKVVHTNSNDNYFFNAATGLHSSVQKKGQGTREEKLPLKSGSSTDGFPSVIKDVVSSHGHKMDSATRTFMESGFGYYFQDVQIHHDGKAGESSSQINALAYTHGNHVVFGEGQYQPQTQKGKQLLAHELTHVIQQGNQSGISTGGIQMQAAEENNDPIQGAIDSVGNALNSAFKFIRCSAGSFTSRPVTNPMNDISTFQSPGASGWFGAKFGCYRNACSRNHSGWDIHATVGTPVYAVLSGTVQSHSNPGGYGDYIDLTSDADNNIVYRYAHLSQREINGHYCPGDKLGETGITGNAQANRPHLHLQISDTGNPVDPVGFLTEPSMVIELSGTAAVIINKALPEPCAPC